MRCPTCHRRIAAACPAHGAGALDQPSPIAAPVWPGVDELEPVVVLGGGGGGVVWGCVDRAGDRVAVKIAASRDAPRMVREAEAQRWLGPPTTARLFRRTRASDGRTALVMEWLAGETLAARLASLPGRWPLDALAGLAAALAARIDTAHRAGIAHRDLKPENIWLEPDGAVRLLDLGVAALGATTVPMIETAAGDVLGTPCYMAPEQALGEPSHAAADLYSFGAIVFELVTGRPPFVGADVRVAHASRRAPAVSSLAAEAAMLDDVIAACLAKRAADRPRTAAEVARLIDARLGGATRPGTAHRRDAGSRPRAVALLGIPSATAGTHAIDLHALATATAAVGGIVARAHPDGFVVAFPGVAPADGLGRARELARNLGVTATAHVAELGVRSGVRGVRVTGRAIDDASVWWTSDTGLSAIAASYGPGDRAPADARSSDATPSTLGPVALVGRADAVAGAVEHAIAALAAAVPAIVTIIGEPGVGTTRVLDEVVAAIAARTPGARLPRIDADDATALHAVAGETGSPAARAAALRRAATSAPLVIAVDGAHRLDPELLDTLEQATFEADATPIVVVAAAQPELYHRRPLWGDHAARARRIDLAPLEPADTRALLRALLAPVEYVAEPAIDALAALVHGIPGHAVEVVRQLRGAGAIRRATGGGWYLASDELVQVSATQLAGRLADRVVGELAPDVRSYARIAAVLGEDITAARLDAIRVAMGYALEVDAAVALARLAAARIVVERGGRWSLRHDLLRDAIALAIPPGERAELHRAALAGVRDDELAARARHALGAGEPAVAGVAQVELGDLHRAARRDVDAERAYTAALEHVREPVARARALLGRGKVRYRLQRLDDAAADLAAAEPFVDEVARPSLFAEIRLERATVADWRERWAEAAELVEGAEPAIARAADPALAARLQMARGRALFRAARLDEARRELAAAAASGDPETATIAKMLLGLALVWAGDLDGAQAILDAVIASCEAAGDRLHQCAALSDRMWVWIKRDALDRAIEDQRMATELARALGHTNLERCSTYNLAELLYWRGCPDEALPLARRARSLQDRFLGPVPFDALLVARIQAARDQLDEVTSELAWVDAHCGELAGAVAMQRELVGLAGSRATALHAWQRVVEAARATTVLYELPEALWFAARTAVRAGAWDAARGWLAEARELVGPDTSWSVRFDAIAAGVAPDTDHVTRGRTP